MNVHTGVPTQTHTLMQACMDARTQTPTHTHTHTQQHIWVADVMYEAEVTESTVPALDNCLP